MTRIRRALGLRLALFERLPGPIASVVAWLLTLAARVSSRRSGLVLLYHGIGEADGDPRRELVPAVGIDRFKAQVGFLAKRYRVVRAADLQEAVGARRRWERFPVAITFDDDLPSHLRAVEVLHGHASTGTVFLTGASLDSPRVFWWERLQAAFDRGLQTTDGGRVASLPEGRSIHEVAEQIMWMTPAKRREVERTLESLGAEGAVAGLDRGQVAELGTRCAIGFHTRDHPFLPTVPDAELADAVGVGAMELASGDGGELRAFAYPHGGFDERVVAAVRAAGFRWAFTTQPEPVTPDTDPLQLGRWEPPIGVPLTSFALALIRLLRSGP